MKNRTRISPGAAYELRYLAGGGSSVSEFRVPELRRFGLITKPEYCPGNGRNAGCDYPMADLTDKGRRIAESLD